MEGWDDKVLEFALNPFLVLHQREKKRWTKQILLTVELACGVVGGYRATVSPVICI